MVGRWEGLMGWESFRLHLERGNAKIKLLVTLWDLKRQHIVYSR